MNGIGSQSKDNLATAGLQPEVDAALLDKMLSNQLSEQEAWAFARSGPEVVVFTLLALQMRVAQSLQGSGPNTPSGAIPPNAKPNTSGRKGGKNKKKRGGQSGHPGRTRDPLPEPDRTRKHQLPCCPDCQGELRRTGQTRSRRNEDISEDLHPVLTEDIIHRDWCPNCKKQVEPKIPDVLPACTLGNRTLVLATLLHFLQGLTIGQIVDNVQFSSANESHRRRAGADVASAGRVAVWLV